MFLHIPTTIINFALGDWSEIAGTNYDIGMAEFDGGTWSVDAVKVRF